MLKNRILTALILIPLLVLAVLFLPVAWFCILTGAVVVYAAWEWAPLMGVTHILHRLIFPMLMVPILFGSLYLPIPLTLLIGVSWWIIASLLVFVYPRLSKYWMGVPPRMMMGLFTLIPCWLSVNFIRHTENGAYTLLFLFVLIWGADSGAYFVGKQWGKHKLAPVVSPGKTWEGLIGALVVTLAITLISAWLCDVPTSIWGAAVVLTEVTVLFSVMGDLFESMLKRQVGLKDSGQLFPGHGGLLDRIDSLTAAAPIFALGGIMTWQIYH